MKNVFNITEKDAKEILEIALSTGGDFAEVYMEKKLTEVLAMTGKEITDAETGLTAGAAIRIVKNGMEVNESITTSSVDDLKNAAKLLASSFDGKKHAQVLPFVDTTNNLVVNPKIVKTINKDFEIDFLTKSSEAIFAYSPKIVQFIGRFLEKYQDFFVFASDGTWASDVRTNTRVFLTAVASDGTNMQDGSVNIGRNQGLEMFDGIDPKEFAISAAKDAVLMLDAIPMVGGDIPVVINNGFGGVILHEACVHGLEATAVAKGKSVFCGKLGQKVASDIVNAVDSGVDKDAWGSINVDDEGTPTKCNVLIENGVLKSYLVDKVNAAKMNHPVTGSSRRESYKYRTTSRMTNTYFLNGTSTFDEIIKNTKYGLFAEKMGGGSVDPSTGEFNFAVNVGYLIEDGKITKPVKGATLVGSGKDVLFKIDMIANNLDCAAGMCGSSSGSVPTNVGQPTIRVSHMTVGGKGESK